MKVLIVDDEPNILDIVEAYLAAKKYQVYRAETGAEALEKFHAFHPDLIVLDLMLPDMAGGDVCAKIREESNVPIIMLTARSSEKDILSGLQIGADDYMVKPFELPELEARVRALTRRSAGTAPTIVCGSLTYDQVGRVAQLQGQMLDLSAREIGLLEVLLNRMGRLVSKDQLVDHLCGWGEEVSHNAIEVYVHRLRKKLEPGGVKIATVRGLGYCLERPQGG